MATALITAGAKRIGQAISLKLAHLGFDIALHYNTSEIEAKETSNKIKALGCQCFLFQSDLSANNQYNGLISKVKDVLPDLSLLVNNASCWEPESFLDSSLESLQKNMRIHLEAPYCLSRDFATQITSGQIINIIDALIQINETEYFPYLLSKKSLYNLTLMLAKELAPAFRVNAIAPGHIPMDQNLIDNTIFGTGTKDNPRPRLLEFLDCLELLVKSQHLTGQCIFLDNGKYLI